MTHVVNMAAILRGGILPLNVVRRRQGGRFHSIAEPEVQELRDRVQVTHNGVTRNLHEYAPLYFSVRTPMLFSRRALQDSIAYIEINPAALELPNVVVADGNAAMQGLRRGFGTVAVHVATAAADGCFRAYRPSSCGPSGRPRFNLYAGPGALDRLPWGAIQADYWGGDGEAKRQKHAEALVPGGVPPTLFQRVHTRIPSAAARVEVALGRAGRSVPVALSPALYFASTLDFGASRTNGPESDCDPTLDEAAWNIIMARAEEFDYEADLELPF